MGHVKRYLPGTPCWTDLATTDPAGAKAFYTALFGWAASDTPMGPDMVYTMLLKDGRRAAALFPMDPGSHGGAPPHWQTYISVADVEAARARVETLGGTAITEVMDISAGRFCVAADPQGAAFYLFENPSGETGPSSDTLA